MSPWETVPQWLTGFGTLVLATVAVFQETIRGWFYKPIFQVSIKTEPPDCSAVPLTRRDDGSFLANAVYLRIWVENNGNVTAKNVEVYANDLRRQRADDSWESINTFPSMNLKWANLDKIYFPRIAPKMGKHCDVGYIVDPERRHLLPENMPSFDLSEQQTSLTFGLMVAPNNKEHIIGPGKYQLDVLVAAENARPIKRTITISLQGTWDSDETKMLRDGVGVSIEAI